MTVYKRVLKTPHSLKDLATMYEELYISSNADASFKAHNENVLYIANGIMNAHYSSVIGGDRIYFSIYVNSTVNMYI